MFEVVSIDGKDLISTSELPAHVSWTTGQNKRDENAFAIFATDDVKT
jgi:hypothetical protein